MLKYASGTINRNNDILKIAEEYYNKVEESYKEALKLDSKEAISYYRKKIRENKTTDFTLLIPDWLKICIDNNDAINLEIIRNGVKNK